MLKNYVKNLCFICKINKKQIILLIQSANFAKTSTANILIMMHDSFMIHLILKLQNLN